MSPLAPTSHSPGTLSWLVSGSADPSWSPPAGNPTWEQRQLLLTHPLRLLSEVVVRPLPGQLPRPTAGFACEAWNAAPAAAENHGNSWAFRPPCAGSFLSDDIFHLAKIPRIPHFPSAVRSDLFPSKLKSLSFIVQFLTIGGSRCSSELGNGRETCWTVPLSIFQQSTAWGTGVSLGHRSGHIW